jgi:hypothetical protein
MRSSRILGLLAFTLLPAAPLPAQLVGSEFRVNAFTTFGQYHPDVAFDELGDFMVVWSSERQLPGDSTGSVFARRFASSGSAAGIEVLVNTYTTGQQNHPSIARIPGKGFIVSWDSGGASSSPQDGSGIAVFGQRLDGTGGALGLEFRVNTGTTGDQKNARVAADSSGAFVVVWAGAEGEVASTHYVFAQRYSSSGSALGSELRVNTHQSNDVRPAVASDRSGNVTIVWQAVDDTFSPAVFARRYGPSGAPYGSEFRVNTTLSAYTPRVGSDPGGNFVIVWAHGDGSALGIFAQRYAASGAQLGGEFRVNTVTTNYQMYPSVALDASGNFCVVWQDTLRLGIFGQRYRATGAPDGGEFSVSSNATFTKYPPAVAMDGNSDFTVVWETLTQDGFNGGIFGQRGAAGLHGDASGDGSVNVGDVFFMINYLFAGGPPPVGGADVNGDGVLNVADVFYLINSLFAGGPPPK